MNMTGTWMLAAVVAVAAVAAPASLPIVTPAAAQGYLEQKDNDALGVIERALAKVDKDASLFDGKAIPAGADLARVGELVSRLNRELDVARRHLDQLSPAGQKRPQVATLAAKYNDLAAYTRALVPVYNAAAAAARDGAAKQATADAAAKEAGIRACTAFRKEIHADPTDRERLQRVVQIADGVDTYWQTVESGAQHKAAMTKAATLCARPEYTDIGRSCAFMTHGQAPEEPGWCAAAARVDEIMKQNARNLAAFHARNLDPGRTADELAGKEGWIDIEGPVTWTEYFYRKKQRDLIVARLAPVFAQAGLSGVNDLDVFTQLDAHYARLADKAKELAPSWDLPGTTCSGAACAAAKKTATAWYPKSPVKKLLHKQSGWTVVQNGLGIATHRYKSGWVLVQVKGDPLCQLRAWTVTENHKGGGRYEAATGAQIGYVRWQPCR
jgi:hypothetical protein